MEMTTVAGLLAAAANKTLSEACVLPWGTLYPVVSSTGWVVGAADPEDTQVWYRPAANDRGYVPVAQRWRKEVLMTPSSVQFFAVPVEGVWWDA